jgi:hypothetical protein
MAEGSDGGQLNRLWDYRLFVESMLYTRLTSFLTFETILLAVVGTLYTRPDLPRNVLKVLVVTGLLITLIWLYVQHNVRQIFLVLENRALESFPEHRETVSRILRMRRVENRLRIRTPALLLMTYVAPTLVALVWIALLILL